MSDLAFLDTPMEVLAERPRLDMLLTNLKARGFRPRRADLSDIATAPDPVLVDLKSLGPAARAVLDSLPLSGLPRDLIVLGATSTGETDNVLALPGDRDLDDLVERLRNRRRRRLVEAETALRLQTLNLLSGGANRARATRALTVLAMGSGDGVFTKLVGSLRDEGVSCVTTLTQRSAADAVVGRAFDAIVMAGDAGSQIADWLEFARTSPALAHRPIYLFASEKRGDERICLLQGPPGVAAARIACDLRRRADTAPLRPADLVGSALVDASTCLFSRLFIDSHLAAQLTFAEKSGWPVTLLALRLRDTGDRAALVTGLSSMARVLSGALRAVDAPAKADRSTLVASLLGTSYAGAVEVSCRLSALLAACRKTSPLRPDLQWRAVERRRYHSADLLLKSVTVGPFAAMARAA